MKFDGKTFHAVNAIMILDSSILEGNPQILLAKRSMSELKEKGKWSIPGGKVEEYSFVKALKREVNEELGINLLNDNIKFFTFRQVERDGLLIQGNYYICKISKRDIDNIVLDENEISEWKLFNLNEKLLEMDLAFNQQDVLREYFEKNPN